MLRHYIYTANHYEDNDDKFCLVVICGVIVYIGLY